VLIRTLFCVEDGDTKTRLRRILRARTDTFVETARSAAVAIVVSSTDGNVRVFHLGAMVRRDGAAARPRAVSDRHTQARRSTAISVTGAVNQNRSSPEAWNPS
jgi:hypothetical protein